MVQYINSPLDRSFAALSDATRRGIIDQLGQGDASISTLADQFQMTLTGMKKHVQVLQLAGLVVTQKVGRVRTCKLGESGLKAEADWIEAHRKLFEARFDALDELIAAEGIRQGLEDLMNRRTRPARAVFDELRAEYDIPG